MGLSDTARWVGYELRDNKLVSLLNVLGVVMNMWLFVTLFALASGVEQAAIERIKETTRDLLVMEVHGRGDQPVALADLGPVRDVPGVRQVAPVVMQFVTLEIESPSGRTVQDTYVENVFLDPATGVDARLEKLTYMAGRPIGADDADGVVVSDATFQRLARSLPDVTPGTLVDAGVVCRLRAIRGAARQVREFPCRVVGVTDATPEGSRQTYVALQLATRMDDWIRESFPGRLRTGQASEDTPDDREPFTVDEQRLFDRIDVVAAGLPELARARDVARERGLATESVLDRIAGVSQLITIARLVVVLLGGAAFLVSIANVVITLLASVVRRHNEIGLLKALGADDRQVTRLFVVHAIVLMLAGSVAGIILALLTVSGARLVVARLEIASGFDLFAVDPAGCAVLIAAQLVFGVAAAWAAGMRAARVAPVDLLRATS